MSRKIEWQRCFRIPKNKLNIFLIKLQFESNQRGYFEAEYVFQNDTTYDVVVNGYNKFDLDSPHNIEKFVKGWQDETQDR